MTLEAIAKLELKVDHHSCLLVVARGLEEGHHGAVSSGLEDTRYFGYVAG